MPSNASEKNADRTRRLQAWSQHVDELIRMRHDTQLSNTGLRGHSNELFMCESLFLYSISLAVAFIPYTLNYAS